MPSEVILPRVDMDMATGKISKWLVAPGTTVTKGQPLFEIETDKATMEIEAEAAGTIRDLAEAGSTDIPVGSVVAWIFAENEAASQAPATKPDAASKETMPAAKPEAPARPAAEPQPRPGLAEADAAAHRLRATPLARRLARMDGIDLRSLKGSGPRGRIQANDVVAPVAEARPALRSPEPAPPAPVRAPEPVAASVAATPASSATGLKRLREGSGRPLVLVHGFGGDAGGWRPFLQGLSLGRPVLAVELPAHGGAALDTVGSFDDVVEIVGAQLTEHGEIDVVAHSLGAAVMTAVAARGLADLRSLLLLSPAGLGPDINGPYIEGFLAASSEAALTPWMAELVADPRLITPALVRATLKLRGDEERVVARRRFAEAVFPGGTQGFSIRAELAGLRMPTRVVFGTADRIIPARHAAALPRLVALHLLPNVGHMPHLEDPGTVAAILAQILAS